MSSPYLQMKIKASISCKLPQFKLLLSSNIKMSKWGTHLPTTFFLNPFLHWTREEQWLLLIESVSYWCNQMPEINNLWDKRFILSHGFSHFNVWLLTLLWAHGVHGQADISWHQTPLVEKRGYHCKWGAWKQELGPVTIQTLHKTHCNDQLPPTRSYLLRAHPPVNSSLDWAIGEVRTLNPITSQ